MKIITKIAIIPIVGLSFNGSAIAMGEWIGHVPQTIVQNNHNGKKNITIINHGTFKIVPIKQNLTNYNQFADDIQYSAIGWDSSTQTYAPLSCWSYNITLRDHSSNANSYANQKNSNILSSLGISASIGIKAAEFSGSGSVDWSQLYNSTSQGVNIGATAYSRAIANIQITGLNDLGKKIYKNSPAQFSHLCGDKVLSQLPVAVSISFALKYAFESSTTNRQLNTKFSASYSFVDAAAEVNNATGQSKSNVKLENSIYYIGGPDTDMLSKAADKLGGCLAESYSDTQCLSGLLLLSNAAEAGYQKAVDAIGPSGKSIAWQSYLATDYTNPDAFKYIDTSDELSYLGIQPIQNNPSFAKYESAIIQNLNVLHDLYIAQKSLQDIAAGINNLTDDYVSVMTPYSSAAILSQKYLTAMVPVIGNYVPLVNACLNSNNTASIDNNCSLLNVRQTAEEVINRYATSDPNVPYLLPAIMNTVKALIYNDNVTRNVTYNNKLVPYTLSENSYMVYLPVKEANKSKSPYVLITIPLNPNLQIAKVDGEGVPVYLSAYQYGSTNPEQIFWGDWDQDSAWSSGTIGYYDGHLETLTPEHSRDIINSVTATGIGTQSCNPFAANSAGCIYTVTTGFDHSIHDSWPDTDKGAPEGIVIQTITDTYDPNLEPNKSDIFGTNTFATLYPFNKHN